MGIVSSVTSDAGVSQARMPVVAKAAAMAKVEAKAPNPTTATDDKPAVVVTLSSAGSATASAAAGKSFSDVTTDTRAALDANLAKMKGAGHTLGMGENQGTQADIDAAFQGLDRRSLFAIANNSGGVFSKDEQSFAQTAMAQKQVAAMGMDKTAAFMSDPAAGYLAGVRFLDSASPEERSSDNWRVNRAAVQTGYESSMARDHQGQKAENVDSGDPVVNLMVKAIHNSEGTWTSVHDGSYVTDISQTTLFKDGKHASELQQARADSTKNTPSASAKLDMKL